jgi:FkbM family methyltransferase
MKVPIVEIGTSDFSTEAGKTDGLFIEPVKPYFDRLPECRKENIAISDKEGELDIFYIDPLDISQYRIPKGLRGCSSINKPHPTVIKMGYEKYIRKSTVKVERIKTVLDRHGITDIEFLKVDTEGHDYVILNDFLDTCDIRPSIIQFESNILSNESEVTKLCDRLHRLGYKTRKANMEDIIAEL